MALPPDIEDREFQKFAADANGDTAVRTLLTVEDIQIGAVEIKDGSSDNRAVVTSGGALLVTSTGVAGTPVNVYNQITVPATTELTLATYIVPVSKTFYFGQVIVGGDSSGRFKIRANASILFIARNNAAQRTLPITFKSEPQLAAGNTVDILVYNESNQTRTFEGTINGSIV